MEEQAEEVKAVETPEVVEETPEEKQKKFEDSLRAYIEEQEKHRSELRARVVPPHKKKSRVVEESDVERVLDEAYVLRDLCFIENGSMANAFAMAHPQIDDKDPLRFFVLNTGAVIVNPKIVRHTKFPVDSKEACMSNLEAGEKNITRYHKIDVEFQSIDHENKKLTEPLLEHLAGPNSKVFQHEIAHLNGHYCFDEDFTPEHALEETN